MGGLHTPQATSHRRGQLGKIDAPLNKMLESVEWGEYRLGDLFEIENTFSFNKDALTPGNDYDYVTRTSQNQGILQSTGFVNYENINDAGTWSLGLLQMDFFYRRKQWYAGQFVRKIVPKICLTDSRISFFSTILNKQKQVLSSVLVRDVDEVFRNITCLLPTRDDEIDYEFMERFIAELNAQRLAELNAYLSVTGLKDYTLTPEEEQAVKDFEEGKVEWDEYRLGDLFEIRPTKAYKYTNRDLFSFSGDTPVVTNTSLNNGISGTVGLDPTEAGGIITYSDTTTSDAIFYQPYPFVGYSHIQGLYPKNREWRKNALLYVVVSFRKSSNGLFDYGNKFNRAIASDMSVALPTREGEIDFVCMETLISAIQKLVIKDVVLYADREIEATKNVIDKTSKSNSI